MLEERSLGLCCQQGNGGSLPSPPWGVKTNSCSNCTNKVDYDKTVGYHRLLCLLSTKDWKNLFPQVVLWGHCHRAKEVPFLEHICVLWAPT